jgi:hypothetical protein
VNNPSEVKYKLALTGKMQNEERYLSNQNYTGECPHRAFPFLNYTVGDVYGQKG